MGSPLGLPLAYVFLVYFEKNWLENCPSDFKSNYHRRFVDEIFVWFTSPKHLEAFRYFLNGLHANITFTVENEKQNRISFLDVQIIRENKTFTNSVYCKRNFSVVYTHFDSFLPSTSKPGNVYALAYKCLRICLSWF